MSQNNPPPAEPPHDSSPVEPPHGPLPSSRKRTIAAALIGALVGGTAVGSAWLATSSTGDSVSSTKAPATGSVASTASPKTFTLTGDFVLTSGVVDDGTGGCEGTGGYDDITFGTSVTVYDAAGAVIATSSLALSEFDEAGRSCSFDISVGEVPADKTFYQVEISHRGKIQLSAEEAKAGAFSGSLG